MIPKGNVKGYYNENSDRKWDRHHKSPYDSIEFEVSKRFISKYLTPGSSVADIGGGPGKDTLWLLEENHKVTLVDLSGTLLERAGREISKSSKKENLLGIHELELGHLGAGEGCASVR